MEARKSKPQKCTSSGKESKDPVFVLGVVEKLNELRHKQLLCDTTIEVEGESFHVHRCVLTASSPYFQVMFTEDSTETQEGIVRLKETKKCGFEQLLNFAYTGHVALNDDNIQEVLTSSHHYCYPSLHNLCVKYMESAITKENCLLYVKLAEMHDAPALLEKADQVILDHFSTVSKMAGFVEMPKETLCRYISGNQRPNTSELEVFGAVRSWLKHQPKRLELVHELMKHVQFNLLTKEQLTKHVLNCDLIRQDKLCMDLLLKHLALAQGNVVKSSGYRTGRGGALSLPQLRPTLGAQHVHTDHIFIYSSDTKHHIYAARFREESSNWALSELGLKLSEEVNITETINFKNTPIILTKDREHNYPVQMVHYDATTHEWEQLAILPDSRVNYATAILNDHLVFIGGYHYPNTLLSSAIQYSFSDNTWQAFPGLPYGVEYAAACNYQDHIYISGGLSTKNEAIDYMFAYTPAQKMWVKLAPLPEAISGHGMFSAGSNIYTIEGKKKMVCLYSPENNQWTHLTYSGVELKSCSGGYMFTVHKDTLCAVGSCKKHRSNNCCLLRFHLGQTELTPHCLTELPFAVGVIEEIAYIFGSSY